MTSVINDAIIHATSDKEQMNITYNPANLTYVVKNAEGKIVLATRDPVAALSTLRKGPPMGEAATAVQHDPALYKEVWEAMNACNGRALLNTWNNKWAEKIWREIPNRGTDAFNQHPINIIVADKLLQLAGVHVTDHNIQQAYSTVLNRTLEGG